MPEIAEVETVKRTLEKQILNKKIISVNIIYPRMIESNVEDFKKIIPGRQIVGIERIGKWLLFDLKDYYLLSHLRMEGKFFLKNSSEDIAKHEHIIFTFEDNIDLRYHDTRKFGRMNLVKKEDLLSVEAIKKQGYEPGSSELTKEYLFDSFKNKSLPIKTTLLDQTIISGLGNIYADEVLFGARIHPLRKTKELELNDCKKIITSSEDIIQEAIEMGGTTIKSYTSSLGITGRFQQKLMVHKREKEPCKICNTIIKRIKVNGRSTYFCERCQK